MGADTLFVADIFRNGGHLPPHPLEVDDTIDLPDCAGVVVRGQGASFTGRFVSRLVWTGPPDRPMFVQHNNRECWYEQFLVDCQAPLQTVFLSLSESSRPNSHVPYDNTWHRVKINGRSQCGYGWRFSATSQDWNNSEMLWNRCEAGLVHVGWQRDHEQAKDHVWRDCGGSGDGKPGSVCIAGTSSILCEGLSVGSGYDWIFDLKGPNDFTRVVGLNAEGCKGLLRTGTTRAIGCCHIEDCRFTGELVPQGGDFIQFGWAGPLRVSGLFFKGRLDQEAYINMLSWQDGAMAIIEGNVIRTAKLPWKYATQQRLVARLNWGGTSGAAGTQWPSETRVW